MQEYEYHARVSKGYLFNLSANLSIYISFLPWECSGTVL